MRKTTLTISCEIISAGYKIISDKSGITVSEDRFFWGLIKGNEGGIRPLPFGPFRPVECGRGRIGRGRIGQIGVCSWGEGEMK